MAALAARCPICRYHLTGLAEPRCPECGEAFTPEEWTRRETLIVAPALERLGHTSLIYALPAAFLAPVFTPSRFLRGLRHDAHWGRAVLFFALELALAPVLAMVVAIATAEIVRLAALEFPSSLYLEPYLVSKLTLSELGRSSLWTAARTCAFLLTGVLVWTPTLVALDLLLWRNRRAFRLLAKAFLYTTVWWFWPIVLMATAGNRLLVQIDNDWMWGFLGGWSKAGAWPWICWLAALVTSVQFVGLLFFVRSRRCALAGESSKGRRIVTVILTAGWLLALYLLLLDWHVQLRFALQFVIERLYEYFE